MTIDEIKAAVDQGQAVCWVHDGYRVIRDGAGQYLIMFQPNQHCIGLTNRAGKRLNGREEDYYIAETSEVSTLESPVTEGYDLSSRLFVPADGYCAEIAAIAIAKFNVCVVKSNIYPVDWSMRNVPILGVVDYCSQT